MKSNPQLRSFSFDPHRILYPHSRFNKSCLIVHLLERDFYKYLKKIMNNIKDKTSKKLRSMFKVDKINLQKGRFNKTLNKTAYHQKGDTEIKDDTGNNDKSMFKVKEINLRKGRVEKTLTKIVDHDIDDVN